MTRSVVHLMLVATVSAFLVACSDSPSAPVETSSTPKPGTVSVHLNGTVASGFSFH